MYQLLQCLKACRMAHPDEIKRGEETSCQAVLQLGDGGVLKIWQLVCHDLLFALD